MGKYDELEMRYDFLRDKIALLESSDQETGSRLRLVNKRMEALEQNGYISSGARMGYDELEGRIRKIEDYGSISPGVSHLLDEMAKRVEALEKKVVQPLYYIGVDPCIPKSGLVYYSKYEKRSGKERRTEERREYDDNTGKTFLAGDLDPEYGRRQGERRKDG